MPDLSYYKKETRELVSFWQPRNQEFKEIYEILDQKDKLKSRGLESFVSNEPRTLYNLALFLLTPPVIGYNIPIQGANAAIQEIVTQIEKLVTTAWAKLEEESYAKGQQGWLRYVTSLMLATGWYSVFSTEINGELVADIWNPAEVYPDFDDIGMARCVHYYRMSASGARKKCHDMGWHISLPSSAPVDVTDYWEYDENGNPENTVLIGEQFAKPPTAYPTMGEIPIFCSPVGGLPDRGLIQGNSTAWKKTIGQSILGTNKNVFDNYNRQVTFMQQILRDSAQPRIIVRSKSKGVVNSTNWNVRGAIYELDTDETIETLAMPGVPPELTTQLQVSQGMIQRGGFAYSLFSGGETSGYAQSLVSASAQQVLTPYRAASSHLLTDICNGWLRALKAKDMPPGLPEEAKFKVDVRVSIPGDLIQRATTARQLDPDFEMSSTTIMNLLFPEIIDPNNEMVLTRRDKAMASPEFAELDLIGALQDQAQALQQEGNTSQANLYLSFAKSIQARLEGGQPSQPTSSTRTIGPPGQANSGAQL